MSDLIPIYNDERFPIKAKDLYLFLGVKSKMQDWCKRMFEYGFTEGSDYLILKNEKQVPHQGSTRLTTDTDYLLTLDCAKEIAMIQRTERGKQARQYFIEVERRYKQMQPAQLSPAEQLLASAQLMVAQERRMKQLEAATDQLATKVAIVEARQTTINEEYFTLAGYYNLHKRRFDLSNVDAQRTGKSLKKYSQEHGYEVLPTHSGTYGRVNTYHREVLHAVLHF